MSRPVGQVEEGVLPGRRDADEPVGGPVEDGAALGADDGHQPAERAGGGGVVEPRARGVEPVGQPEHLLGVGREDPVAGLVDDQGGQRAHQEQHHHREGADADLATPLPAAAPRPQVALVRRPSRRPRGRAARRRPGRAGARPASAPALLVVSCPSPRPQLGVRRGRHDENLRGGGSGVSRSSPARPRSSCRRRDRCARRCRRAARTAGPGSTPRSGPRPSRSARSRRDRPGRGCRR